ncbi:MAG: hypothetical protein ISEC1_P0368 [Thiomicrorhabdus sp.]|nr:MAG: hypothetical protein ISEC1_P0368 [Thiomicrorhabdus sp.]
MNAITPALSAAQSLQPQQNQMNAKPELKLDDKSSTDSTNGGNSTVTLSEAAQSVAGKEGLAVSQTIQNMTAAEEKVTEANQTTSGLSNTSNVQSKIDAYNAVASMEG